MKPPKCRTADINLAHHNCSAHRNKRERFEKMSKITHEHVARFPLRCVGYVA